MAAPTGSVPPPPNYPPSNGSAPTPSASAKPQKTTNVNVNKAGIFPDLGNLFPPVTLSFTKTIVNGGGSGAVGKVLPGSGFTSDEDIRAYSEALRREARPRAVERALDAETLESVLKAIPDVNGSLSGSRARARRVSRPLKRIAAAEKLIAKQAAVLYATFSREFDAELARISRGRASQRRMRPAIWKS